MANHINDRNLRKTFLTSFRLNFPMNFSISATEEKKNELKSIFKGGRMSGYSSYMKDAFMKDHFGVKDEEEIISKYFDRKIYEIFKSMKYALLKKSKVDAELYFQQWAEQKTDDFIKLKKKELGL